MLTPLVCRLVRCRSPMRVLVADDRYTASAAAPRGGILADSQGNLTVLISMIKSGRTIPMGNGYTNMSPLDRSQE